MNAPTTQPIVAPAISKPQLRSRFKGRFLALARVGWWIIFGAIVVLNLLAIPLNLQLLQRECVSTPCYGDQLNLLLFRSWLSFGLTREAYARLAVGIGLFPILIYLSVAFILFVRKSQDPVVFFTSLMLATFGGTYPGFLTVLPREHVLWWIPTIGFEYIGSVLVILFFYIFPNGKFVPRWTQFIGAFWAIEQLLEIVNNPPVNFQMLPPGFVDAAFLGVSASAVFAQYYRYRRVRDAFERRQTKWVTFGTIAALVGVIASVLIFSFIVPLQENVFSAVLLSVLLALFICLIPISIGISILRSRLWDIDLIINRTLVYGIVTAVLAGVLAVSSDLTKRFFLALTGESSELAPMVATLMVVAVFEPVRAHVQRLVDQHVKYATGSLGAFAEELGKYLELNDADALSRRFLKEALSTLGAESGAIYLGQSTQLRLVTSTGQWDGHAELAVPIEHRDNHVGLIALGARTDGESYDADDRATLRQMAELVARAIELAEHLNHETTPVQPSP